MKVLLIRNNNLWYCGFVAGFFLLLTFIPQLLALMAANSVQDEAIYHGNLNEPKISIVCNVFWGEEYLPQMLGILKERNIKATFFIGGSWAKRNPEMLKKIAAEGHELGNHSYSHPHPNSLSKEQNKEQISRTEALIYEYTGRRTKLYAPPYGEYNKTVLAAAGELEYSTIMWSIDTIDWKRPKYDVIVARVIPKLHNGAIILMHPTEPTVKALPEIIDNIQKNGYSIYPVSLIIQ